VALQKVRAERLAALLPLVGDYAGTIACEVAQTSVVFFWCMKIAAIGSFLTNYNMDRNSDRLGEISSMSVL